MSDNPLAGGRAMSNGRKSVAMVSGIFAIRGHAWLNDLHPDQPKWWIVMVGSVACLGAFIEAVGTR